MVIPFVLKWFREPAADDIFPGTMIFMAANRIAAAVSVMALELSGVSIHHASLVPRIRKCVTIMETTMRCMFVPVYNDRLNGGVGLSLEIFR